LILAISGLTAGFFVAPNRGLPETVGLDGPFPAPKKQFCRTDETIFQGSGSRPETASRYKAPVGNKGAIMLSIILNAIYREFLNSAVPGIAILRVRR
jgi:hypothetical protein